VKNNLHPNHTLSEGVQVLMYNVTIYKCIFSDSTELVTKEANFVLYLWAYTWAVGMVKNVYGISCCPK
jgi:hypothetical protein